MITNKRHRNNEKGYRDNNRRYSIKGWFYRYYHHYHHYYYYCRYYHYYYYHHYYYHYDYYYYYHHYYYHYHHYYYHHHHHHYHFILLLDVKLPPKAVTLREEAELQNMLDRLAQDQEEVDGDAPEE